MKYDLEERRLAYTVDLLRLVETMPGTRARNRMADHLLRSSASAFLNHGEAQAAESRNDFVHKVSVSLKERREGRRARRLVAAAPLSPNDDATRRLPAETEELIRIFAASVRTAKAGSVREPRAPWVRRRRHRRPSAQPRTRREDQATAILPPPRWHVVRWTLSVERSGDDDARKAG